MALSNAERQARYRARLKQQAAAGIGIRAALMDFLRDNPDEVSEGGSPEIEAHYLMEPLTKAGVSLQATVDAWREYYPDADFSKLDAALRAID